MDKIAKKDMDNAINKMLIENKSFRSEIKRLIISPMLPLFTRIYNAGYHAGHHDTVESCYIDILHEDFETYHKGNVFELVADIFNCDD